MNAGFMRVGVVAVLSLLACAGPGEAGIIWSEDFNGHPDLNSGNWHTNITDGAVPVAGTWSTADGTALSNNAGSGTVQANAQYAFTAAEKGAFGGLYDVGSGLIGGGSVSGTLYIRFDGALTTTVGVNQFGYFQTQRGSTTDRSRMDTSTYTALSVGNRWGSGRFQAVVNLDGPWNELHDPFMSLDQLVHTFVMRIDFVADADESATIWLDPVEGVNEVSQSVALTSVTSVGDLSFDTFVLRAGNTNTNWRFDNVMFATTFGDVVPIPEPTTVGLFLVGTLGIAWRVQRRRRTR